MSYKKPVLIASRLCTATRGNLGTGADNEDITGYVKTNEFIVVAQVDEEAGPWNSSYSLQWRNVTDSGSFATIASTGQCKWGTATDLVNGTAVTSKLCSASGGSGSTWQNGEEVEGAATSDAINLADEYYTEIHFAVSLADAHDSDQYEFQLLENNGSTAVGTLAATIVAAGVQIRELIATITGVSSTPVIGQTIVRSLSANILGVSTTPSIANSFLRSLSASIAGASTTLSIVNTFVNDFATDTDCVALWKMESGALTTDSKGTNTLTDNNTVGTSTTDYKQGSACALLEHDNNEFLSILDADLDTGFPLKSGDTDKNISVSLWFKGSSNPAPNYDAGLFTKMGGGVVSFALFFSRNLEDTKTVLNMVLGYNGGASEEWRSHASGLSLNTWYHLTATYRNSDKAYTIRLRDASGNVVGTDVEGTATLDANKLSVTTQPVIIGTTAPASYEYFDGLIDEVVVFKDILTADEATAIAKGLYKAPGLTPGFWPLNFWSMNFWQEDFWSDYGEGAVVRELSASILGASVTPGIGATSIREILANIPGVSVTPAITNSFLRALLAAIVGESTTPGIDVLTVRSLLAAPSGVSTTSSIGATLEMALEAGIVGVSATPSVVVNILRAINANIPGVSVTPEITITLQTIRALEAAIAGVSVTPSINVLTTRSLLAALSGASVAPTVQATIGRFLLGNIPGVSTTPSIAALSTRAILAAISGESTTPSILSTSERKILASIAGASITPNITISMAGIIQLIAAIAGVSVTPSISSTSVRVVSANIPGISVTPDASALILRQFLSAIAGSSATPDILATSVRSIPASILGVSVTPNITITMVGLIQLIAAIAGVSVTPDISTTIERLLLSSITGASITPNIVAELLGLYQAGFRFRNDDGDEDAATWKEVQNGNISLSASQVFRLRKMIDALGNPTSKQFQLEYRHKPFGGSFSDWTKVE